MSAASIEDIMDRAAEQARRANGHAGTEEPWPDPELSMLSPHRLPAPELPLDLFGAFWAGWLGAAAEAPRAPAPISWP